MAMTRQERLSLHKKQERTSFRKGRVKHTDLKEGVSEIRDVGGAGLTEFIKVNGSVNERRLTPSGPIVKVVDNTGVNSANTIPNTVGVANNASVSTKVPTSAEFELAVASLAHRVNRIIDVLREQGLIKKDSLSQ
tara:strand:+ start:2539 stop:2943 length:405 start_codon:yes stop_codon:yes gene_type:complete